MRNESCSRCGHSTWSTSELEHVIAAFRRLTVEFGSLTKASSVICVSWLIFIVTLGCLLSIYACFIRKYRNWDYFPVTWRCSSSRRLNSWSIECKSLELQFSFKLGHLMEILLCQWFHNFCAYDLSFPQLLPYCNIVDRSHTSRLFRLACQFRNESRVVYQACMLVYGGNWSYGYRVVRDTGHKHRLDHMVIVTSVGRVPVGYG